MATDPKQPPVAVRVTRPYSSEDEFLQAELDTITRTGVVLLGTQSRPSGVVLRFELALESGTPLLRGEGRVVSYKMAAGSDVSALTLRFTRLDTKSKSLVDRVAGIREARARQALDVAMGESSIPPRESRAPERIEVPALSIPQFPQSDLSGIGDISPASLAVPLPRTEVVSPPARPSDTSNLRQPNDASGVLATNEAGSADASSEFAAVASDAVSPAPSSGTPMVITSRDGAPRDAGRASVLDRLRDRSKHLSADRVREIQEIGQALRKV